MLQYFHDTNSTFSPCLLTPCVKNNCYLRDSLTGSSLRTFPSPVAQPTVSFCLNCTSVCSFNCGILWKQRLHILLSEEVFSYPYSKLSVSLIRGACPEPSDPCTHVNQPLSQTLNKKIDPEAQFLCVHIESS